MLHSCLLDIFLYLEIQRSSDDAKHPMAITARSRLSLRVSQLLVSEGIGRQGRIYGREKCIDLGLTALCTTYFGLSRPVVLEVVY